MTQTAKHTPGPWEIKRAVTRQHSPTIAKDRELIATAWNHNEANARLIAAAPELLAALKVLVDEFDRGVREGLGSFFFDRNRAEECRAAIAKAEGR